VFADGQGFCLGRTSRPHLAASPVSPHRRAGGENPCSRFSAALYSPTKLRSRPRRTSIGERVVPAARRHPITRSASSDLTPRRFPNRRSGKSVLRVHSLPLSPL